MCFNFVDMEGIEPSLLAYQASFLPLKYMSILKTDSAILGGFEPLFPVSKYRLNNFQFVPRPGIDPGQR